ncbi:hypothetical protein [Micromonospora wenchangensis]|uniref:hypothetical protein n=1 Tax=Micromonospora wenchangensis TaxID=1185415 RepID=UPI003D72985D
MRRKSALDNDIADVTTAIIRSGTSASPAADAARRSAVAEEQGFLDSAVARRDALVEHLQTELSSAALDVLERARLRMLRQQYEQLRQAQERLVFGRLGRVS